MSYMCGVCNCEPCECKDIENKMLSSWIQSNVDNGIKELLLNAKARVDAMTPEERKAMYTAQRASWVKGELGMGNDADEARYRKLLATEGYD